MIRVAVANQKGGVGKTTTAINLATALAAMAGRCCWSISIRRVTPRREWVGRAARERSTYDVLLGEATFRSAVATKVPRLDLLPATVDLSGAEIELVSIDDRTTGWRRRSTRCRRDGGTFACSIARLRSDC